MKSLMSKMLVAAAAVAVCAGTASAQRMKSEIPFSFKTSGAVMPAGEYQVELAKSNAGIPIFRLLNTDANRPVLVVASSKYADSWKSYSDAKLVFRCGAEGCALTQIWTGTEHGAYDVPTPKSLRTEARLIEVRAEKAE